MTSAPILLYVSAKLSICVAVAGIVHSMVDMRHIWRLLGRACSWWWRLNDDWLIFPVALQTELPPWALEPVAVARYMAIGLTLQLFFHGVIMSGK